MDNKSWSLWALCDLSLAPVLCSRTHGLADTLWALSFTSGLQCFI